VPPDPLPAQSLLADEVPSITRTSSWPHAVTRDWAIGDSTGAGVKVCVLDSGVDPDHPAVGGLERAVVVESDDDGTPFVREDGESGDLFGHGTACAGIIRKIAPNCDIASVRVLGSDNRGNGAIMAAGLKWAIEQGYRVINMSLSTTRHDLSALLHDLIDDAWYRRTVIFASAHNRSITSYPWRFSSVFSVGSHEEEDPLTFFSNPEPPVEFFAKGVDLEVAWLGGSTISSAGNSFATAHLSGIAALVLARHPQLASHELKNVLHLISDNMEVLP
jgi:subtilisin family serine protease